MGNDLENGEPSTTEGGKGLGLCGDEMAGQEGRIGEEAHARMRGLVFRRRRGERGVLAFKAKRGLDSPVLGLSQHVFLHGDDPRETCDQVAI